MRVQGTQVMPSEIPRSRNATARTTSREPRGALAFVAGAVLTLMLVPVFIYSDMSVAAVLPLALLIGLTSQCFFELVLKPDSGDVFHPTILVAVYFALYFALRSFYLWTVPFFARMGHNPYDDYLPAALWCACGGYFAFLSGMGSKTARLWLRHLPRPGNWPQSLPASRLLLLMVVGLASLLYLFKIGMTVGNYGNLEFQRHPPPGLPILLQNLTDLSWVALCIFLVTSLKKTRRGTIWLLLGISVGILGIKLAISGGKVALIQPVLQAAIVFHYGRRRFRLWEMLMVGVPVVMLAFGVVNFYRFVVVGQHGAAKNLSDVASRVSTASDMLSQTHGKESALEQMVGRNAGTDALAVIMKYTPHPFPYVYGRHWIEVPLTFIPRQIWKDKPINMPSAEFESTYLGLPSKFNGFSSMHLIGDLYRNFSWAGVLCGMFLVGILLRALYLFCSPCRENPSGLFLYAALFPEIIHSLESDLGYAIGIVTRALILTVVAAMFLGVRFRKVRRVASSGDTSLAGGFGRFAMSTIKVPHSNRGIIPEASIE
jgi:O-antigen polysaccharide polymerase Wzy